MFLASFCDGYTPADFFNMDETGYFCRDLPNSTLNQVSKSCKGGKLEKDRVTVSLTCCGAAGEKPQPLMIGKCKKPRCFFIKQVMKNVYQYQSKLTMKWRS